MKKVLYGSTALVAAGAMAATPAAAEEGISLGLSGYYNAWIGVSAYDEADGDAADYGTGFIEGEGEVHFTGSTTLDNGVTFGVQVQLEAEAQGNGDEKDENYIWISGSFGRVIIGSENSAHYLMAYGAPSVGIGANSGWITNYFPRPATGNVATTTTFPDLTGDRHGITYFSPRFSGFQIGATYVPAVTGTFGEGVGRVADEDTERHHGISVGANFVESFGSADVAISAGYQRAENSDNNPVDDDATLFTVGVNVGFAGFTVGGSYAKVNDDSQVTGDGWSADAGVSYSTGPWGVSVTGFYSETSATTGSSGDDELVHIVGSVSYAVGPGITAHGNLIYGEWDTDGGDEADGVAGIVGVALSF